MKMQIKNVIKNFSFSITSNLISLMISTLVIAIVPKIIGVNSYGYFQLYLFYASYIGFFHLGWCDGIYLNYGGAYYSDLNKKKMSAQFWLLFLFELVLIIAMIIVINCLNLDNDKSFILLLTAFSIIFVIPKTMLSYILQSSSRIKEYSLIIVIEKVIYCLMVLIVIFSNHKDYKLLIFSDILGKIVSMLFSIYVCKDIVFSKLEPLKKSIPESINNVSVGSKLMVANIAGMLILGIVRMAIEDNWSIETFGKVSLAISISNLMMVFVNAIGIVLFPMLRRINNQQLKKLYSSLRDTLMLPLLAILLLYYPMQKILVIWLPNYEVSFRYMALLFPVCIFESKMQMLINIYLKALRKEKFLLKANLITVAICMCVTLITVYLLNNLELAVFSILLFIMFRCVFCEIYISKLLNLNFIKDICSEVFLVIAYVSLTWFFNIWLAFSIYLIFYVVYMYNKREYLKAIIIKVCKLRK